MALTKAKLIELIDNGDIEVGISNPMPDDTLIVNLNADKLDGYHASDFAGGGTNLVPNSIINTTSAAYGFGARQIVLKNSTTYTMSVRAKRNAPSAQLLIEIVNGSYNWSAHLYTATNDYSIRSVTFTTAANVESYTSTLRFYSYPRDNGGTVTVDWVKIEKGTMATDWTPALEDITLLSYPIGAIYQSSVSTSPATLFGRTWASITPPAGISYAWKRTA